MKTNRLVIIGAGGHGKVAAECAESMGAFETIVFLDTIFVDNKFVGPWPIVDVPESFADYLADDTEFFVAIGNNSIRQKWLVRLQAAQARLASLIHASATLSDYSNIGEGTLLCAHSVVNPFTEVGVGCIINTGATIDHDCQIADFVHIAPGCKLAGIVTVDKFTFLGIGTTVIQQMHIGKRSVLGAGSVVVNNVTDNALYVGVPATKVKRLDSSSCE
jgi:sugar O-acyltransferase (sialic acid O-acetyltransferase NeuD family)